MNTNDPQNEYANVQQKIELPNVQSMLDGMSAETKHQLMYKTRLRILNELSILDANFWMLVETNNTPPFDKQMELIAELYDYGFMEEAKLCIDIMQTRIDELFPSVAEWFKLQKQKFVFKTPLKKGASLKGPIFLEDFRIEKDLIYATWCFLGLQNDLHVKWVSCAFSLPELVQYMEINGYQYLWQDVPNPIIEPNSTTPEAKRQLSVFIQENIEKLIKEYIQEGFPTIQL